MVLVLILGARLSRAAAAYLVLRGHFARDIMRLPGLHNCIARLYTHTRARTLTSISTNRFLVVLGPLSQQENVCLRCSLSAFLASLSCESQPRFAARIVLISRAEFIATACVVRGETRRFIAINQMFRAQGCFGRALQCKSPKLQLRTCELNVICVIVLI
jgi:hypothetical protein